MPRIGLTRALANDQKPNPLRIQFGLIVDLDASKQHEVYPLHHKADDGT